MKMIKINADITVGSILRQVAQWNKSAATEKLQAHTFACSLMARFVKHGNRDEIETVAQAIENKFGEAAAIAFRLWVVKTTNLLYDPNAKEDKDKFSAPKGAERTFDLTFATSVAVGKEGDKSFFSLVERPAKPWDLDKAMNQFIAKAVENGLSQGDIEARMKAMWTAAAVEARKRLEKASKAAKTTSNTNAAKPVAVN